MDILHERYIHAKYAEFTAKLGIIKRKTRSRRGERRGPSSTYSNQDNCYPHSRSVARMHSHMLSYFRARSPGIFVSILAGYTARPWDPLDRAKCSRVSEATHTHARTHARIPAITIILSQGVCAWLCMHACVFFPRNQARGFL